MKSIIAYVILIVSAVRSEFPANFPKCKYGDEACFTKAANDIVGKYSSGLRDVNLLPFDPLRIKSIVLDRNPNSPNSNIELKLSDVDMTGLKNMKDISFSGFNPDLKGRIVFEAMIPELTLKGQYSIDGRILLLPIVGSGDSELTAKNAHIKYSYDLKPIEKNGQIYASLEHVKLDMVPESIHFQLDNLFNGDKALSDNMNRILNENWQVLYGELSQPFSKAIGLLIKSMMNTFFEKYPYAEYFQ